MSQSEQYLSVALVSLRVTCGAEAGVWEAFPVLAKSSGLVWMFM